MERTEEDQNMEMFLSLVKKICGGILELMKGLVLIALILFMYILVIIFLLIGIQGNQYYTEKGFVEEMMVLEPKIVEVTKIRTSYISPTQAEAVLSDGTRHIYCLNSDVLYRYNVYDCAHPPYSGNDDDNFIP